MWKTLWGYLLALFEQQRHLCKTSVVRNEEDKKVSDELPAVVHPQKHQLTHISGVKCAGAVV